MATKPQQNDDVLFADHWSEGIFTGTEVAHFVEADPMAAMHYHVVGTKISFAEYQRSIGLEGLEGTD